MSAKLNNRESWLIAFVKAYQPIFEKATDLKFPSDLQISCSLMQRGKAIGVCFDAEEAKHVFIDTRQDDVDVVTATIAHELIHACGIMNHGSEFKKAALAIGLKGRMTATTAGDEFLASVEAIREKLGAYPHIALKQASTLRKKPVPSARMVNLTCPECGFHMKIKKAHFEMGLRPVCPMDGSFMRDKTEQDMPDDEFHKKHGKPFLLQIRNDIADGMSRNDLVEKIDREMGN